MKIGKNKNEKKDSKIENKDENKNENKVSISDKISLKMRKRTFVSRAFTIFIVIDLLVAFIAINLIKDSFDLPEIDVTANKIYTLSEASKKPLSKIEQDVKIYLYGIDEKNPLINFIKQYCNANEKITYEILTNESNLEKVQEYELEEGYSMMIVESGESHKIINTSEFYSFDYATYTETDLTEQTITNAILALVVENKPKIYFVQGHNEFSVSEYGLLSAYLTNEAMEYAEVNLMAEGKVPDDCNVLAIMSPESDLLENEAQYIIDYINKGGNIFLTEDVLSQNITLTNLQKVLELYGVNIENGYIIETSINSAVANYPYVFKPQIASSQITQDISAKNNMWLAYSRKLNFISDEELQNLKVTHEDLLTTTDSALFITDFSQNVENVMSTAQQGKFVIASLITKEIPQAETENNVEEEQSEEETTEEPKVLSKLLVMGNGRFITDYIVNELSPSYPISYLGNNKDFALNSFAYLGNKENGLTIRKDMAGSSYAYQATKLQNAIVLIIIFAFPVLIIAAGIIVWLYRKKRK